MGARGDLSEINLVFVVSEPAEPGDGEIYCGSPEEMFSSYYNYAYAALKELNMTRNGNEQPFHSKFRKILDIFIPETSFEDQMRKVWITDSVLCSAKKSGAVVDEDVEKACAHLYLRPQRILLSGAFWVALGNKAKNRMDKCGLAYDAKALHPSASDKYDPSTSWSRAAKKYHDWAAVGGDQS